VFRACRAFEQPGSPGGQNARIAEVSGPRKAYRLAPIGAWGLLVDTSARPEGVSRQREPVRERPEEPPQTLSGPEGDLPDYGEEQMWPQIPRVRTHLLKGRLCHFSSDISRTWPILVASNCKKIRNRPQRNKQDSDVYLSHLLSDRRDAAPATGTGLPIRPSRGLARLATSERQFRPTARGRPLSRVRGSVAMRN